MRTPDLLIAKESGSAHPLESSITVWGWIAEYRTGYRQNEFNHLPIYMRDYQFAVRRTGS